MWNVQSTKSTLTKSQVNETVNPTTIKRGQALQSVLKRKVTSMTSTLDTICMKGKSMEGNTNIV